MTFFQFELPAEQLVFKAGDFFGWYDHSGVLMYDEGTDSTVCSTDSIKSIHNNDQFTLNSLLTDGSKKIYGIELCYGYYFIHYFFGLTIIIFGKLT